MSKLKITGFSECVSFTYYIRLDLKLSTTGEVFKRANTHS